LGDPTKPVAVYAVDGVSARFAVPCRLWVAGVMEASLVTVIVTVAVALPLAPLPVTTYAVAGCATVGVPEMTPVVGSIVAQFGKPAAENVGAVRSRRP